MLLLAASGRLLAVPLLLAPAGRDHCWQRQGTWERMHTPSPQAALRLARPAGIGVTYMQAVTHTRRTNCGQQVSRPGAANRNHY